MTDTKFQDEFSKEVWTSTYKDYNDNNIDDTFRRVSKYVASVEKTPKLQRIWEDKFYDALTDFKVTAGGRIYSNAGTEWAEKGTGLLNCYVAPRKNKDIDSLDSILSTLQDQSNTLKSEGGWGENFSYIRPRGGFIYGVGVETPGAVKYMEIFDKTSDVITSGSGKTSKNKKAKGKIRKGAMMGVLDVWHPDIFEFITAKQKSGRLTKFNMSANCTNEFMARVIEIEDNGCDEFDPIDVWDLKFPDTQYEKYKDEWDGDLKLWEDKGYPTIIYDTVSVKHLWNIIMESTYNRAEPGILWCDRANEFNPAYYLETIRATNPCGEQFLAESGVCDLSSYNLTQFIKKDPKNGYYFDFEMFEKYIPIGVRFLDNVNSVSNSPLPEYKYSMEHKRRIGLGILGWGSLLFMLKIRFGSMDANTLRDKIMQTLATKAYESSIDLAIEKGMFSLCDPLKHAEGKFIQNLHLSPEYMDKLRTTGIRNSSVLSCQPTGNTSILSNIVSGGIEPLYMTEYIRTVIVNDMPDEISDVCPKWYEGEWHETDMFNFTKEGDEEILKGEYNGIVYKIDKNRGLTKEVLCEDYGVRWLKALGEYDPSADYVVTTTELSADDHLNDLKGFARWVDSALSKCVVGDTLLSTNKGIIPIKDITNHDKIPDTFNELSQDLYVLDEYGIQQKIVNHYYGGLKDTYEIKFNNGKTIQCSEEHSFKTQNGFVKLKDLSVNDKVFYNTSEIRNDNDLVELPQPTFKNITSTKKREFPQYMTKEFALFLGMWLADGYVNKNTIGIVEKNKDVSKLIDELFKKIFNITPKIAIDKRSGVKSHNIHSRELVKYFKKHFGKDCVNKKIPDFILKSSTDIQKELLRGLTLDGYKKDNMLVIYEGYSEDIQKKTTSILASMGIQYYNGIKKVPMGRKSKLSYMVGCYSNEIVPIEDHKISDYKKHQVQRYVEQTNVDDIIKNIGIGVKESAIRRNFKNSIKRDNFVRSEFLDKIKYNYDCNISCVKIKSINYIGKKELYDIEVENTHSYLIDGIVSHNTINLPNDYSFEDFKNIYIDTFKTGYVKGITTYRAGTMASVLSSKDEAVEEEIILDDVKMPQSASATIKTIKAEGKKWYLTIVYHSDSDKPFALFVKTNSSEKTVNANNAIDVLTNLAYKKGIPDKHIETTIGKINKDTNASKITRIISLMLRHGVLIKNIVLALDTIEDVFVGTFLFQIKKFLSSYVKDGEKVEGAKCENCGSSKIEFSEGCFKCIECGSSKCG